MRPKTSRKKVEAELDRVCSRLTIARDKGCQVCGSVKTLASHHCFGRRNMSVRWDMENLVCLCYPHHRHFAHGDPCGFATWLERKIGREAYDRLTIKAKSVCKRTEFDLLCLLNDRRKELKKYEEQILDRD